MEQKPLISTIIPVYNRERYLSEAIESVLAQSYPSIELIIINDGSTDSSAEIAKRFTNKSGQYFYQENSGIGAARNQGIRLAKGEYLAFLDSDDIWLPEKLSLQFDAMRTNPKNNMVFGHVLNFLSPELSNTEHKFDPNAEKIFPGYFASALLIKREDFLKVGYFSTGWQVGEFIDWYARAQEIGMKPHMLPDLLVKRRIHQTNIGVTKRNSRKDYAHILRSALERRRKQTK
jgi:glycosyltransferase involved in cell wall biosynthesis